ncbi:MAG: hypothetical protein JWM11_6562 [Planctomycetaceae bacterium]|nr:hypothetical protein [Planctomycetaceae bacterium]
MKRCTPLIFALAFLFRLTSAAFGLGPQDVYLVVNQNVPESQAVADHYCAKRGVPVDHVLKLDLPIGDDMSRADFNTRLASPLRESLKEKRDKVKVLLTVYGVPLRVGGQDPTAEERKELELVQADFVPLENRLKELESAIKDLESKAKGDSQSPAAKELSERRTDREGVQKKVRSLERRRRVLSHQESHAAVDSELALLWWEGYDLDRFHPNLLYFQVTAEERQSKPPMLMTCRLDGPSVELVKRMIDQAIEVEAKGLEGKVYVDARGIAYNQSEGGFGYGGYDQGMRDMAKLLEQDGKMAVILDDKPELFASGVCTECALYCGWYSVGNYVDCCRFLPGAVAWHLASFEAVSLHDTKSKQWCRNLLENGAVATLGPVAEPYTIGFPKPAEFFGTLVTGEYTLVETYWRTELFASWMTVLIGDPLYNPYAKASKLKIEQVKPSPAGSRFPRGRRGDD